MHRLQIVAFTTLSGFLLMSACAHKSGSEDHRQSASNSRASTIDTDNTKIGVPECDDLVAKYEACIAAHVPADQQRQFKENIDGFRRAWRQQLAANPETKQVLPAAGKRHLDQARVTMSQFGCEF